MRAGLPGFSTKEVRCTTLVLSRKLGEKITIGDGPDAIELTVVDIDRGKIRLGIRAPRQVPVYRNELLPVNKPATEPGKVAD